jgi:hypothetical protein
MVPAAHAAGTDEVIAVFIKRATGLITAALSGLFLLAVTPTVRAQSSAGSQPGSGSSNLPSGSFGENVEVVGYTDLNGHPAFKMAIQQVDGRWLLYLGSFWERGWMIVDVTNPAKPQYLKWIPGPHNTTTVQMDWAGNARMETPLARIPEGRDFDETKPYEGGFYMWDLTDPLTPKKVGQWKSPGTHRNFYDGGRYVYATTRMEGYEGQILVIVDVSDPADPKEAGRWWVPGQHVAAGEKPAMPGISLHGPAYPVGNLLYAGFGSGGMIVLDISDISKPKPIGKLTFSPPFKSGNVTHSVLPLPDRKIAIVNSESAMPSGKEAGCKEPANHVSIVDISDPGKPWLISQLPRPLPPAGFPFADFCDKGRFGPHNINLLQHSPFVEKQNDILYVTYFTAGVRIFSIADPRAPKEVGYFIPPDPKKRYVPLPANALVTQTEDVLVDSRGYIYITDRNQGV